MALFDVIVDSSGGGDVTTIDAGLAASGSVLVKSGTYTEATITLDQNNTFLKVEPGTTLQMDTGGFVWSANECQVEFGPGCTVDNAAAAVSLAITISGTDNHLQFKNNCVVGNISVTSAGDRFTLDGGGWNTVIESIDCDGDDSIIQYSAWDSKANATITLEAIDLAGNRGQVKYNKIIDSDSYGLYATGGSDHLLLGNIVLDSDLNGLFSNAPRTRFIGNFATPATNTDGLALAGNADDSIVVANYTVASGIGNGIDLVAAANNCVVVANRTSSISDASATSTVQFNDLGTASCTVTGTAQSGSITEADVVAGGKTLILTLTASSWRNQAAGTLATAFQALLTGDEGGGQAWEDHKATILASGTVVRTSATVMTITYAAAGSYDIASNDTITLAALDETVLESETSITANDTSYLITFVP